MSERFDPAFFLEHASELCCVVGPDDVFLYVNKAWQRLLGWSSESLVGSDLMALVHPDDRDESRAARAAVAAGAPPPTHVSRFRGRDGAYRWLEWRLARAAEDGSVQAIARDITEERRQRSHAEITELAARVGTWEVDRDTNALFWSHQTFALHEVDPASFVPTPQLALSFYPPEARSRLRKALDRLLSHGVGFDLELPLTTGKGRSIWVHTRGMSETRAGQPARVFGTVREVTDERRQRQRLERLGAVARHTTNSVILLDAERRIDWVNPAFRRQSGRSRSDVLGRPVADAHPSDEAPDGRTLSDVLDTGRSDRLELMRWRADGAAYWVDVDVEPLYGSSGRIDGFILVETDITESRRNAQRLEALEREARAAHDRFIDAVEALPDAFVLFDADDRLVMWNARYAEFYALTADVFRAGVSFAEIEQHALARGQLPDAEGREEAWLAERLAGRKTGGTIEQRLPDGRYIRTVERRTSRGELVAFHVDITTLKRQQEKILEARNALQTTLDAIPDLLFELDAEGRFLDARSGNHDLFYRSPEAHIGATVEDILPHWVAAMWRAAIQEAEVHGTVRGLEYALDLADGTHWFELSVARKQLPPPAMSRFVVAARDISERKGAEAARAQKEMELSNANEELRKALTARDAAESRFFDVAAVSHDWFWEQDAEGRFTFMSESVRRVKGLTPEMHIGRTRAEIFGENDTGDGADWDWLNARIRARKPFHDFVYRHPRVGDGGAWVRISGAPFYDSNGRFAGYRGVGSDVTALREAQARAEEASAAKSRFLANMSHEIRTPLNGIIGLAALMADSLEDAEARDSAGVIRDSGEALVSILNDVLDFSKVEAGRLTLEISGFKPAELVDRVVALHRLSAEENGVAVHVSRGAWAQMPRSGDPHRILQILHNLMGNAVKFTGRGEITVTLECTDPGAIVIEVRDTGIGMSKEQLARIFDEFSQADATISRQYGGTGLGMSISKRLAELMGGMITVDSAPGAGTSVHVTLRTPLLSARDAREQVPNDTATPVEGLKVLAADDNATNRLLLGKFLNRLGAEATVVDCGGAAVTTAAGDRFDVLLLDIRMPDMTGAQVLGEIRRREADTGQPATPAVAVTANAMRHQVESYLSEGFDAHIAKPLRLDALADALRGAVDARGRAAVQPLRASASARTS